MNSEPAQFDAPDIPEVPLPGRHRHGREAEEIVRRNYDGARVIAAAHEYVVVHDLEDLLSNWCATPELAWENALFQLTQLNAWLLWKAAGEPDGDSWEFWFDAEQNLQDTGHAPSGPGHGTE